MNSPYLSEALIRRTFPPVFIFSKAARIHPGGWYKRFFRVYRIRSLNITRIIEFVSSPALPTCFFAKWARPVKQTRPYWTIEKNIAKDIHWDVNSAIDPEELRTDHLRYERWPPNCRRYEPTRLTGSKSEVYHSIRESISFDSRRFSHKTVGKYPDGYQMLIFLGWQTDKVLTNTLDG